MLKSAYNKQNPNLVFEIEKIDRESLGATGIKEVYVGTLVDTSIDPDTRKENYKVQVQGFESDWVSTPGTMGISAALETKSITITENTTTTITPSEGKDGMSSVEITTEVSSGDTRWQEIGYDSEPDAIQDGIDYAKQIMQNWDASITNRASAFANDKKLLFFPNVDMSNVNNVNGMFNSCTSLLYVGDIDFSKITTSSSSGTTNMFYGCSGLVEFGDVNINEAVRSSSMFQNCTSLKELGNINIGHSSYASYMFSNCTSLTEIKSINFLVTSCTAPNLFEACNNLSNSTLRKIIIALASLTSQSSSYKTLKHFGLSQTQAELCTTFDEWTDLANDGWTTGYES